MRRYVTMSLLAWICALALLSAPFSPGAAQQQCSSSKIIGGAIGKDRGKTLQLADLDWERKARGALKGKKVYHSGLHATCTALKSDGSYSCRVSAKACAATVQGFFGNDRCELHPSRCEICCFDPVSGSLVCDLAC